MARKELDRFDTKAKRDIQILTKLTGIVVGSILFSCVLVGVISLEVFERGYLKETQHNIEYTSNGVKQMIDEKTMLLKCCADMISQNPAMETALVEGDYESIKMCIEGSVTDTSSLSAVAITDANGNVVQNGGHGLSGNLSSYPVVRKALSGSEGSCYDGIADFNYAIVYARPIRKDGDIVGSVVCVYDFTDGKLITSIQNGFNVECTIFKDKIRVDSTLAGVTGTALDNEEIVDIVLRNGSNWSGKNRVRGQDYYSVYEPLQDETGNITGMFFIAKSVSAVLAIKTDTVKIVTPVAFIVGITLAILSFLFIRWLMWRISNVTNFLKELESGEADLTKRSKLFIRDEIGDLVIHFDFFLDKMQQIVSKIKESKNELDNAGSNLTDSTESANVAINQILSNISGVSSQVASQGESVHQTAEAVDEISQTITNLNRMIENQSSGVSQASAAVEQMIGNISSVNASVDKMASSFTALSSNAQTGFNKQQNVNERIKEIESQSEMLVEANQAISSIAEQTNLLAMNAAIEAAHAGEAGKGFSVVADEIRKLSETSSAQSKTIGEQLNKIKDSITEVVSASSESSSALEVVSAKIKETDELVIQIKAAMEEQNEGSKQIGTALKDMNDSTVEVRKASKEMAVRNEKIMHEVDALKDVSSAITGSMEEMSDGANKISDSGTVLNEISQHMQGSIDKIGGQIDLFKV